MNDDTLQIAVLFLIIQLIPLALITLIKIQKTNKYGDIPPSVRIRDAFSVCIWNYFNFKQRATRTEFWTVTLIFTTLDLLFSIVEPNRFNYLFLLFFIPSLSVGARRLHDINRSGWWQLLSLIPFTGWVILTVFYLKASQNNDYGIDSELGKKK